MEDKGKKLYEIYAENMLMLDIEVDDWDDLTSEDKTAWDMTAQQIMSDGL